MRKVLNNYYLRLLGIGYKREEALIRVEQLYNDVLGVMF